MDLAATPVVTTPGDDLDAARLVGGASYGKGPLLAVPLAAAHAYIPRVYSPRVSTRLLIRAFAAMMHAGMGEDKFGLFRQRTRLKCRNEHGWNTVD